MGIIVGVVFAVVLWGLTIAYWIGVKRTMRAAERARQNLPPPEQAQQAQPAQQQDTAGTPAAPPQEPFTPSRAQVRRLSAVLDQLEEGLRNANRQQQSDLAPTVLNLLATIGAPVSRDQLPRRIQEQFDRLDSMMHDTFADFDQRMERMLRDMNIPHPSQRSATSSWSIHTTTSTQQAVPRSQRPRQEARPQASSEPTVPNRPRPTVWQRLKEPWPTTTTKTPPPSQTKKTS